MDLPARSSSRSWLDRPRIVGTPRHWAGQASLLGALLGGLVPSSFVLVMALVGGGSAASGALLLLPMNLTSALVGALVGGLLGLVHPSLLDTVRGRLPVPVIAALQAVPGALAGALAAAAWLIPPALLFGAPPLEVLWALSGLGAVIGGLVTPLWWLPLTVATVLGRSWPVSAAAGLGIPSLLALLLGLLALL